LENPGISAVIITFNEASSIERCLSSLDGIADEIIVVDSFSTDSTEEICRKYNARFVTHEFTGFMDQKNYSLTLASQKYILSLDADEALSTELCDSLAKIKNNLDSDGYIFNRRGNFSGQWINHSAWYPDRQLRLFNKEKGKWGTINIHETFQMKAGSKVTRLKGDLLHWSSNSAEDFSNKIMSYSDVAAREFYKKGKKASFLTPTVHFIWRLFLTYFLHFGFLDGRNGWIVCLLGARSSYLKYYKLRVLYREEKKKKAISDKL
jgi:glycosyltransferase involved in cell wall biosynthesis